jgi:DNA mismatch repair enzyme (predicted ATPase)
MDTLVAHVLKTVEDIDSAPRGVYVVESGTKAYYPVRGLIEEGQAELLGEFFDDGGNHVITVGLLGEDPSLRGFEDNKEQKRAIRIGQEFFITALKDYHDWQEKWWREAVQNSVDGGGKNIHLAATPQSDGTMLVACDDDGRGMDEDTIINKFLVLGATTKTSASGTAGGFGKAKELLLLPWISWRIHSRDREVLGAGIDYEIKEAPYRQGTRLEVVMPADKKTDHAVALAFLEKCYLLKLTSQLMEIRRLLIWQASD